ncbi:hypothetical protein PFICI_13842 [Pestalotiopsis fici W106-1]|uniref:ATP synthase subunit J n=1 Tax=Pestalotiopsis fici (strain W106-1 / CGMCC3.15140) TaxID=1229662 RepID=W3WMD6_PESFW|nr:uncharacterized protein PFICI_13842 [Pestalotiopsis fici W106-1]ETS73976.1 hypothetical protein PFICI_13842 [Pestalotiopsis fici W106-1]
MSWFGVTPLKKFPTPVLKPLAPFFAAGLVILYGVNSAQNAMMKSMNCSVAPRNQLRLLTRRSPGDEWKNDPRNPNAGKAAH